MLQAGTASGFESGCGKYQLQQCWSEPRCVACVPVDGLHTGHAQVSQQVAVGHQCQQNGRRQGVPGHASRPRQSVRFSGACMAVHSITGVDGAAVNGPNSAERLCCCASVARRGTLESRPGRYNSRASLSRNDAAKLPVGAADDGTRPSRPAHELSHHSNCSDLSTATRAPPSAAQCRPVSDNDLLGGPRRRETVNLSTRALLMQHAALHPTPISDAFT
jgi:hypothetical protein